MAELSKAAALDPAVPSLQSYYGQALLFTGDADGATAAFRKELAANPNDYDANFQLASILAHRGKPAEARPLLELAVQVRPGSLEARDALANGFRAAAPTQADSGIAPGSPAPAIGPLDLSRLSKPMVLVFGSYTCPKLRGSAADLKRIAEANSDRVDFRLVYIREAHAEGGAESQWQSSINHQEGISLAPAVPCLRSRIMRRSASASWTFLFPPWWMAWMAQPSRLPGLAQPPLPDRPGGKVAFQTRLGELDFHPADLEAAIREMLAKGAQ